jgi:hypothetical protein
MKVVNRRKSFKDTETNSNYRNNENTNINNDSVFKSQEVNKSRL